ncbi:hypothetical protein IW137_002645 [Coemansia sp. RSA 1287]|nr:hypothetical protein IW137_002645 [Coemansia sp. RSA 1287]
MEKVKKKNSEVEDSLNQMFSQMVISSGHGITERFIDEFNLDPDKAYELAREALTDFSQKAGASLSVLRPTVKVEKDIPDSEKCTFELIRGERRGRLCGKRCVKEYDYCSIHKKAMEKKGALKAKTEQKKANGIKFKYYDEVPNSYVIEGTKLLVCRDDEALDVGMSNCLLLGHWDGEKMGEMTDVEKAIVAANKIKSFDSLEKTLESDVSI